MKIQENTTTISGEYYCNADSERFYFDFSKDIGVYNLIIYASFDCLFSIDACFIYVDSKSIQREQPIVFNRMISKLYDATLEFERERFR